MRRRGPRIIDLSARDRAVLEAVDEHRLLTSGQIERLLFSGQHASAVATRRRCQAVLGRLVDDQLLGRLDRRQGGHRAGSSGFIYRLTTRGHRALGHLGRRTRWQPSDRQVLHVLAAAEISVGLHEAQRSGDLRHLHVVHEPATWRRFTGLHGAAEVLKPDLLVELVTTDAWQLRWFVEVDRATEHLPTVVGKCRQYQRYWHSGDKTPADRDLFPRVLWSVPDERRAVAIAGAIRRSRDLHADLFAVTTAENTVAVLGRSDHQQHELRTKEVNHEHNHQQNHER